MSRALAGLCLLVAASCGDNRPASDETPDAAPDAAADTGAPLGPVDDLVVVAHQDDDLLFMQPDLANRITAHRPVTIVYVTAGDAGAGIDYARSREIAVRAAYGIVLGSQDWQCGWIAIAEHAVRHCRLAAGPVSLVFLGFPDGGVVGDRPASLLRLWQGELDEVETIAERTARYDQDGLIATVADIIAVSHPQVIRTLDLGNHGPDHSDHLLVGALTVVAAGRAASDAALIAYRGYAINGEPVNTAEPIYQRVSLGMRAYEACQIGCAACGVDACAALSDPRYAAFLHRSYAVTVRRPPLTGVLRLGAECVAVNHRGDLVLGDCGSATELSFEPGGTIRAGDRCVAVRGAREVTAGPCDVGDRAFALDDEGHLWAAVPPVPGPGMADDHAVCLFDERGHVRAGRCGVARDVRWSLVRAAVANPYHDLGAARGGRPLRLADLTGDGKADLCTIAGGGLACAAGDGSGRFATAVAIGDEPRLAIDAESLALGDVDGDGRADACGRDPMGMVCATAASGFAAARWPVAFAATGTTATGDRALAVVDGQLCGRGDRGVTCVARASTAAAVLSSWPPNGAALWPTELDDDRGPDWCAATAAGPACGLAADHAVDSDGESWGWSQGSLVEGSLSVDGAVIDAARGAMADVSGDGKADLCVALGGRVDCALSRGHGFGPRLPVMTIPGAAHALWLGDLDGDGRADPCVDDGAAIRCALSP